GAGIQRGQVVAGGAQQRQQVGAGRGFSTLWKSFFHGVENYHVFAGAERTERLGVRRRHPGRIPEDFQRPPFYKKVAVRKTEKYILNPMERNRLRRLKRKVGEAYNAASA
ncbi:MAG TPA: hypothetical protein PK388_03825, partial [Kiritimatiellia bacterium]|nr:hypothetical protein [Kiritimatiellia bacterium]